MAQDLIGLVDIGKTNAKLVLIGAENGEVIWRTERRCTAVECSKGSQLDVVGIEAWLLSSLADAPSKDRVRALVPVAHGAAAVLISGAGEVLAAPDYEDPVFEQVLDAYRGQRDPFAETFSPFLPVGLNLGRQLYYLQEHEVRTWRACKAILLYPQYWAWRLSNAVASELTSLGCHTDLWHVRSSSFSRLARSQGWDALFPTLRRAGESLGTVAPSVARVTGLDAACRVYCGIHDSNASYLCHRVSRPAGQEFAVVSSGTWTVIMAHGTDLSRLREHHGMLANVDAFGAPVATARFMGGREYEALVGRRGVPHPPTLDALRHVLDVEALALPPAAQVDGSFTLQDETLLNAESLDAPQRAALATLYCALRTDFLLEFLGTSGPVIVDGPLAANPLFGSLLATFRDPMPVMLGDDLPAAAQCARIMCGSAYCPNFRQAKPLIESALADYRSRWRAQAESRMNRH